MKKINLFPIFLMKKTYKYGTSNHYGAQFPHSEFSSEKYSSVVVIKKKIENKEDLFERGHKYKSVKLDQKFPKYILDNKEKFNEFIL